VKDLARLLRDAPLPLIGARIRRARREAGLSHDRLAAQIGTSRQHLIKLEKGQHRPRLAMLRAIATATGQPPEWFVDPEVEPSPFPVEAA
jgi:transcriptional regulator with XRE-family HTH domain